MQFSTPVWTDKQLDESILKLCDEFPAARMAACSRAREFCRRMTPHGTPDSLLSAMRAILQQEVALYRPSYAQAA